MGSLGIEVEIGGDESFCLNHRNNVGDDGFIIADIELHRKISV